LEDFMRLPLRWRLALCVKHSIALPFLAACFAMPPAPNSPQVQEQQKAAFAQSMGYPTRKSAVELDAVIHQQTKDFKATGRKEQAQLEALQPFMIEGVKDTCYTIVMRLAAGARWGPSADYLRFDFRSPTGNGSGGPGVTGPGAVVSVGCAEASGPIALTMTPMVGQDPIGKGPIELELWSHKLTPEEAARLEADKQRQIREQREFAEREQAKQQQRASMGCAKCDGRYQGCVGAGRSRSVCRDEYGSCAFHEVGADYLSACPNPNY
jgi:hypothetical protein